MSRRTRTRWVVVITVDAGGMEVFGPWYDGDKADKIAAQLREASSRYGGDGADYSVDTCSLDTWPGIRAATA